jgi:hypothetical protein
VSSVTVSIKQNVTGKYWSGSSFSATTETYLNTTLSSQTATGANWFYALPLPTPDGGYTLHVRATDKLNNQTPSTSPASTAFTIDTTASAPPSITSSPSNPTNQTSASFSLTDTESGVSYQCKLDTGSYTTCSSPTSYSSLAQAPHTFSVEAKDAAGNISSPSPYSWTVDTTAPSSSAGALPTYETTKGFAVSWSASDTGGAGLATVALYAKGPPTTRPTARSPPRAPRAPRPRVASATAPASVTAPTASTPAPPTRPATCRPPRAPRKPPPPWTPPRRPRRRSPASRPTRPTRANASFSFSDSETGVSYQCKLETDAAYSGCSSPKTYSDRADGPHTFSVEAQDAAGNLSDVTTYNWTIDTTPPAAPTITSEPDNPTNQTSASFSFTGESGATFLCSLDNADYGPCTSPHSYNGLGGGSHIFSVEAQDAAGNTSPAGSYTWTVQTAAPPAPLIDPSSSRAIPPRPRAPASRSQTRTRA